MEIIYPILSVKLFGKISRMEVDLKNSERILVTGGAGFIGNNLIRFLFKNTRAKIYNLDKLGYSSSLEAFDKYLYEYNHAFSAYLSSKTFASDTMLKIFMALRYLKALVLFKDKLLVDDLWNRNLIASLVRAHRNRGKISNYNEKMSERFIGSHVK